MSFNVTTIQNQKPTQCSRGKEGVISKYILKNKSHNDQRGRPSSTTGKASSQAYSHSKSDHTATVTPIYISKSHGVQAQDTQRAEERSDGPTRERESLVLSYAVVLIKHFYYFT